MSDKQHAHALLDCLERGHLAAVIHLLETMGEHDDVLSEEDRRRLNASREYFRKDGRACQQGHGRGL